jgi:hypothetical protein
VDGWTVRHDRAATVACYQTVTQGDADLCGCLPCRNFALQRSTAFPPEFLRLLCRLGIDPNKEHEVFDWGPVGDGLRRYGGWFCFVGYFAGAEADPGTTLDSPRFSLAFTSSFPRRGAWAQEGVAAVEFVAELPWLLPDADPD